MTNHVNAAIIHSLQTHDGVSNSGLIVTLFPLSLLTPFTEAYTAVSLSKTDLRLLQHN